MAYDEKTLKRDGSGITPVPQHFNPTINDYEPIYGRNNAGRVEIYGPDGNPISTDDSNKLAVRASEIETILNEIKSKDFATQTTLAAILAKIIAAPATEAKQDALAALIGEAQANPTANTILARLKSLEDKIDAITSGATPATAQLTGSKVGIKKHTSVSVMYNNPRFVGENIRWYGQAGFLAWNCEYPNKMVIIKNTSAFAIVYKWYLYDHLDIATYQREDPGIIIASPAYVTLAAGATAEIPFSELKYPAVGLGLSIYQAVIVGDTGTADVIFLGGM